MEKEKGESKEQELLEHARKRYDRCVSAEHDNRSRAIEALRFKYGEQWPQDIKNDREAEGRPCLTLNRVPAFVRQVINEIRQSSPQIKFKAIDSDTDPDTVNVLNGLTKAIEMSSTAESAYDWGAEFAVTMGWGYWRVTTEYSHDESFDQDICIDRIKNPFTVYLDPDCQNQDGSDARYAFVIEYIDKEDYEERYPDAENVYFGQGAEIGMHNEKWFSNDKARIAEYWTVTEEDKILSLLADGSTYIGEKREDAIKERRVKQKKVTQYIIDGHNILETNKWAGSYIPIIRVVGEEMDIEGETLLNGMVKDMIDPQRQYNYWRSAATERVALTPKAPYIGARGQFKSRKWLAANQKNFPYLEYDPVIVEGMMTPPPARQTPPDVSPGIINEIMTAAEELKAITGIHDPSLGAESNEISGIAIGRRQEKAGISNFHFMDNLVKAKQFTGKILADLIPKIYDSERVVRIIDGDGKDQEVPINAEFVDQKTMRPRKYNIAAGKYDAVVDTGPSYATQREAAADAMLELMKAWPEAAPLLGDLMAKNFDWPDADEVVKRLKTLLPPEVVAGENPQIAAMIKQFQMQIDQMKAYAGSLEEQLKSANILILNKQGDIAAKMAEVERKAEADKDKFTHDMTELELKYQADVPGSSV